MKKLFILMLILLSCSKSFAQDNNPYSVYGYKPPTVYEHPDQFFYVENPDKTQKVRKIKFDLYSKKVFIFGKNNEVLSESTINPSEILRFISIDAYSEKYYGMNPYQYGANNPILNIDVNGDSISVANLYGSNVHHQALVQFVSTSQGRNFLNNYASKGQKIIGLDGKVIYEAKKDGIYHKDGTNLSYQIGNGSVTVSTPNSKDGANVNVTIDKIGFGSDNQVWNLTKAIVHESFVHAEVDASDIHDNGRMDKSVLPSELRGYAPADAQHISPGYSWYNNQNETSSLFPAQAQQILQTTSNNLHMGMNGSGVRHFMWSFGGTNIHVNPKTGKVSYGNR
jgi:hypothetical protein